jgi:hypothetical protein
MVEFTLPKNSKVKKGTAHPKPEGATTESFQSTAMTLTRKAIRNSILMKSTWIVVAPWCWTRSLKLRMRWIQH